MGLPGYCFWAFVLVMPGFALSRVFFYVSGGWRDLLSRVLVANLFAGASAAFLAASFYGAGATMESVTIFTTYLAIQLAWASLDVTRLRLLKPLRLRMIDWYALILPPPATAKSAEPAE